MNHEGHYMNIHPLQAVAEIRPLCNIGQAPGAISRHFA